MMVDLSDESPQELYNFRVVDSLSFDFALAPSNFPLVNSIYETPCAGQTVMYTANGDLTSQDPFASGTTTDISIPSFRAFTITVNQEKALLFVGGTNTDTGNSEIRGFTLTDPLNPLISTTTVVTGTGRVVSVASSGDIVLYITNGADGTRYKFFSHTGQTPQVQVCRPSPPPTPLPTTPGQTPAPQTPAPTPAPQTPAPTPTATPAPNNALPSSTNPTPGPTSAATVSPVDRSVVVEGNSGAGRRGTLLAVSVLASFALVIV
jgi:hypothetical protein